MSIFMTFRLCLQVCLVTLLIWKNVTRHLDRTLSPQRSPRHSCSWCGKLCRTSRLSFWKSLQSSHWVCLSTIHLAVTVKVSVDRRRRCLYPLLSVHWRLNLSILAAASWWFFRARDEHVWRGGSAKLSVYQAAHIDITKRVVSPVEFSFPLSPSACLQRVVWFLEFFSG